MGVINRFFLMLGALALLVLSLVFLAVSTGVVPERSWLNEFRFVLAQQETVAASAVLLLFSLCCFFRACSANNVHEMHHGEFIAVSGTDGSVGIALEAVREMVKRVVSSVNGVRDAKAHISAKRDKTGASLSVSLQLVIGQNVNAAMLSKEVFSCVREQLGQTMNLKDVPIEISVVGITDTPPIRKHRVV